MEIKDLTLLENILVIEEHPVVVPETHNGIMLNPERVDQLKQARRFRTGVVLGQGYISPDSQASSILKGKLTFIGETVVYDAQTADLLDLPISKETNNKLITINANYLFAIANIDSETPNTIE
jgi:hypothetical protein